MGFNLNQLGGLISGLPGGSEAVGIINGIGAPIVEIASPFVNIGSTMLQSVMGLTTTLTNSLGNVAKGLGNFVNGPSFVYVLIGGMALVGVVLISSGGKSPASMIPMKMMGR